MRAVSRPPLRSGRGREAAPGPCHTERPSVLCGTGPASASAKARNGSAGQRSLAVRNRTKCHCGLAVMVVFPSLFCFSVCFTCHRRSLCLFLLLQTTTATRTSNLYTYEEGVTKISSLADPFFLSTDGPHVREPVDPLSIGCLLTEEFRLLLPIRPHPVDNTYEVRGTRDSDLCFCRGIETEIDRSQETSVIASSHTGTPRTPTGHRAGLQS